MKVSSISDRFYSLLGLCQKAGKLVSGSMLCERVIKSGKAHLTIVSSDAAHNTKKKFDDLCNYYNVKIISASSKELLGHAIGKKSRTVVAILDNGFKQMLLDENDVEKSSAGVVNNGEN